MGYLGSQATFTGTQNNKRVSAIATAGQVDFLPAGGYSIGAIDVYRNGIKLAQHRDFVALDGVTVTLQQAANENDILEFVVFENFAVNDVITGDGDSTIRGNLQVSGDLSITGTLNATVSNTLTAGIATEAIRAGIATEVDGFLAVGVTATNLNATGVITASSFSGDGSALTGIAATDDVSTNTLVVLGISTLSNTTAGIVTVTDLIATHGNFSGVVTASSGTFSGNVTIGGTLTYDDVTNIDSVGLITARDMSYIAG